MRLTSFIMGGLVGAAGVLLFSNRNSSMMQIMSSVVSDMKNNKFGNMVSPKGESKQRASIVLNEQTRQNNRSTIESIISSDPQLKKEFEAISKQTLSNHDDTADVTKRNSALASTHINKQEHRPQVQH